MQSLLFLLALGLAQEPPIQIPPPPTGVPAQDPAPTPAPKPAAPAVAPAAAPAAGVPTQPPAATPVAATPAGSAAPLSFFSENFPFAWDRVIPLSVTLDGVKVSSIFFNTRVIKPGFFSFLKGAEFGTRAQVEVTNTGKYPRIPGFAVAVLDKDGRLVGVASGGTKFGTVKPGETETFDLNFTQVKERLASGARFYLAIELRD